MRADGPGQVYSEKLSPEPGAAYKTGGKVTTATGSLREAKPTHGEFSERRE